MLGAVNARDVGFDNDLVVARIELSPSTSFLVMDRGRLATDWADCHCSTFVLIGNHDTDFASIAVATDFLYFPGCFDAQKIAVKLFKQLEVHRPILRCNSTRLPGTPLFSYYYTILLFSCLLIISAINWLILSQSQRIAYVCSFVRNRYIRNEPTARQVSIVSFFTILSLPSIGYNVNPPCSTLIRYLT